MLCIDIFFAQQSALHLPKKVYLPHTGQTTLLFFFTFCPSCLKSLFSAFIIQCPGSQSTAGGAGSGHKMGHFSSRRYSNPTLPLLFYVHTCMHYNKQKGTNLAAPKVKKQAPWQSARCLEACFALIIAHFALKMLKTHLCHGRQKCVTAWRRVQDSTPRELSCLGRKKAGAFIRQLM